MYLNLKFLTKTCLKFVEEYTKLRMANDSEWTIMFCMDIFGVFFREGVKLTSQCDCLMTAHVYISVYYMQYTFENQPFICDIFCHA